jgi:hypothetical protein
MRIDDIACGAAFERELRRGGILRSAKFTGKSQNNAPKQEEV